MTSPRRRLFRFGLRTLFVVVTALAIPIGWVSYQLNWIRERHVALEKGEIQCRIAWSLLPLDAPGMLWLFGEEGLTRGVYVVEVPEGEPLLTRIRTLFPEGEIIAEAPN